MIEGGKETADLLLDRKRNLLDFVKDDVGVFKRRLSGLSTKATFAILSRGCGESVSCRAKGHMAGENGCACRRTWARPLLPGAGNAAPSWLMMW